MKMLKIPKIDAHTKEWFENRLLKVGDCSYYPAVNSTGYGVIGIKGRSYLAHRVAYSIHHGDPGSKLVCHTCDNKPCCNPDHLFVGSHSDNTKDAVNKGRWHGHPGGETHGHCKLSDVQVKQIRQSSESIIELAARYSVSKQHIYRLKRDLQRCV